MLFFYKLDVCCLNQTDNTFPSFVMLFILFLTYLCFDPPLLFLLSLMWYHYIMSFLPPPIIYTAAIHFLSVLLCRVREEGRASQLVLGGGDMPDVPNACLNKPMLTSWGSTAGTGGLLVSALSIQDCKSSQWVPPLYRPQTDVTFKQTVPQTSVILS